MRDIRDDLKERIQMLELQMSGAQGVFEQQVEQLKVQLDKRLAELKFDLDTINQIMQMEQRRYNPTSQPQQAAVVLVSDPLNQLPGSLLEMAPRYTPYCSTRRT